MTTYTWSARRFAAGMFGLMLITMTIAVLALTGTTVLAGGPPVLAGLNPWQTLWWGVPVYIVSNAGAGTAGAMLVFWKRRPWLRLGQRGVELAARGQLAFIPWAAVTSSRVTSRRFVARLVITSNSRDQVLYWWRDSWMPRQYPRSGVVTFKVDLGGMRGGRPAALATRGPVDLRALLPQDSPVSP